MREEEKIEKKKQWPHRRDIYLMLANEFLMWCLIDEMSRVSLIVTVALGRPFWHMKVRSKIGVETHVVASARKSIADGWWPLLLFLHSLRVRKRARTVSSKWTRQQHPRTNKFRPKQSQLIHSSRKQRRRKKSRLDENLSTIKNVKSRSRIKRRRIQCDLVWRGVCKTSTANKFMFGNGARNN